MEKNLVSVITPCYNTGAYVHRLLDSVLGQTYPNIEMFVIDDGSTDNSSDVVASYIPKFEARGYRLTLIHQENSGQSVAIRNGLKLVHGKYLVWPDSDDFYASPEAIGRMAAKLKELGDGFGMVRTQEVMLEDGTFKTKYVKGLDAEEQTDKKKMFEDCLLGINGFYYCSGAYMADFEKLVDSTELEMYTDRNAGQNWQLMLPLLYNYKCFTIKEPLYNVVERLASHSRNQYSGYEKSLLKTNTYEKTILETLARVKGMPKMELDMYCEKVKLKYIKDRLGLAFVYKKRGDYIYNYDLCKTVNGLTIPDKIRKIFFRYHFLARSLCFAYNHFYI